MKGQILQINRFKKTVIVYMMEDETQNTHLLRGSKNDLQDIYKGDRVKCKVKTQIHWITESKLQGIQNNIITSIELL